MKTTLVTVAVICIAIVAIPRAADHGAIAYWSADDLKTGLVLRSWFWVLSSSDTNAGLGTMNVEQGAQSQELGIDVAVGVYNRRR